jgi:hypothetical protein
MIGEAGSILARTRAFFSNSSIPDLPTMVAPEKPVLCILDRVDPLAKLGPMR